MIEEVLSYDVDCVRFTNSIFHIGNSDMSTPMDVAFWVGMSIVVAGWLLTPRKEGEDE